MKETKSTLKKVCSLGSLAYVFICDNLKGQRTVQTVCILIQSRASPFRVVRHLCLEEYFQECLSSFLRNEFKKPIASKIKADFRELLLSYQERNSKILNKVLIPLKSAKWISTPLRFKHDCNKLQQPFGENNETCTKRKSAVDKSWDLSRALFLQH